ncbi:MAG: CvpA family protein [Armatimonadota bacterium]
MNGIDLLIVLVLLLAGYWGARRGIRAGLLDLACIVGGLGAGLLGFPVGWWLVRKTLGMPDLISGPLGFVLMVAVGATVVGLIVSRVVKPRKKPSRASRLGGATLNVLLAYVVLGIFLQLMTAAAQPKSQIGESRLAQPLLAVVPLALRAAEMPGLDLPRVVPLPRSFERGDFELNAPRYPTFRPINFSKLDGSTCIKCRGKLKFLGYRFKGGGPLPSPKYECAQCGRTTDGCQGFESFHKMYQECPMTVANRGAKLDCGVWTNGDWIVPEGPCPVCGKTFIPSQARSRRSREPGRPDLAYPPDW